MMPRCGIAISCAVILTSCAGTTADVSPGLVLAQDPALNGAIHAPFACTFCHGTATADAVRRPGASFPEIAFRSGYWGGQAPDLLSAANLCITQFMAGQPFLPEDPRWAELRAYLESLSPNHTTTPLPFLVATTVTTPPPSDGAAEGASLYPRLCGRCHGAKNTAAGRAIADAVTLVNGLDHLPPGHHHGDARTHVASKVRHGPFAGEGGFMPPWPTNRLTDAELSFILDYLAACTDGAPCPDAGGNDGGSDGG